MEKKKGGPKLILGVIIAAVVFIAFLIIRLNWQRFKVEAGFGFKVAVIIIVALLIIFLLVRHYIKKAQKNREQKKIEKEQERQAKIEAGEPVPAIGDGKFEAEDIKEAAGIAASKIGDFLSGDDEEAADGAAEEKDPANE